MARGRSKLVVGMFVVGVAAALYPIVIRPLMNADDYGASSG